jgi:hypothetical protein
MRPRRRGDRYAFVSGMKKSGTNWVAALVGSHPRAVVWGELHLELLLDALRSYAGPGWVQVTAEDVDAAWPQVARAVLETRRDAHVAQHGRAARPLLFVDHTPGWAALHLGASARYIHVVRDVRDVVVSDAFHSMRLDEYPPDVAIDQRDHVEAWRTEPTYFSDHPDLLLHPAEVTRLAHTWVDVVGSALALASERPDLVAVVRYEDLHADVLDVRRSLLRFLGLDPATAGTELERELRPGFGGRAEDPHGFHRHGVVGDHRTYLSARGGREIDGIAGDLMRQLGYH